MFFHICCKHSALTTAPVVNSFQCTRSHSKRPRAEEDEEESAEVGGAEVPNPDSGTDDLQVSDKPDAAAKLGNAEALSEEETSARRMQVDQKLSDSIKLSGEKMAEFWVVDQMP